MSGSRPGGGAGASYQPSEIALAVALAIFVEGMVVLGLLTAGHSQATPPAVLIPSEAVIPVRAVGAPDPDAPLLRRGGGSPGTKASSKADRASREPKAQGPREVKKVSAEAADSTEPPPADEPVASGAEEATAPESADSSEAGPGGEGSPEGSPDGTEADPLKARAVDLYRARIIAWFSARFRVSGSGLPKEELERLRVPATVTIASDRRVLSYSMTPSGSAPFDAAARAALEGAVGSSIPPPPESYPDVVQTSIHVTFVCRRSQCD